MRILFNTPNWKKPSLGGVASHYYGLKPYWSENVKYIIIGSRGKENTGKYWLPFDLIRFSLILIFWRPDVVVLNPSMAPNALKRDLFFLRVSKSLHNQAVLFIHGFHPEYCDIINTRQMATRLNSADGILVLASSYKAALEQWGVRCPIMTTTTKVDDRMLEEFDIHMRTGVIKKILFLARVEKEKGIYETIDTFRLLQEVFSDLSLIIVGQGSELNAAKQYVTSNGISHVVFMGRLQGRALSNAFKDADLYCFPSYSEGMPTSVLEAMAFGLPIVARRVGGLSDFFIQGEMGYITDSYSPHEFAQSITRLIKDPALTLKISQNNYQYAKSHFMASSVALELENKLKQIVNP